MTTGVQFGQIHHGECEKTGSVPADYLALNLFLFLSPLSEYPANNVCAPDYWLFRCLRSPRVLLAHKIPPYIYLSSQLKPIIKGGNETQLYELTQNIYRSISLPGNNFFFFLNQPSLFLAASHNFLLAYEFTSRRFDFFAVSECTDSRMLCDYDTTLWQYGEEVNSHRGTFWNKPLF